MASSDLPCDGDGVCMACKKPPPEAEKMLCHTCATPWHAQCLSQPPETLAAVADWECPDCSLPAGGASSGPGVGPSGGLVAAIRAIEADESLTEQEKAKRRQELLTGGKGTAADDDAGKKGKRKKGEGEGGDVLDLLDEKFNCAICMQLPERPVTTPCGHNFCLKCFQKLVGQAKPRCANCRAGIPPKIASQPRINSALVAAIRMAKTAKSSNCGVPANVYHSKRNEERPDKAFTTERAKRAGKANACSGQIFVNVPPDHFGPILAENDTRRKRGVLVGDLWEDRMECRQWGAHLPHVAGIAGQSEYGAQSVALSGGYEDDEDHGEWFLYTGSGGRDLSGNRRTNKEQSFDQKFEKLNAALRLSCLKGYPVRVVRSHKEKRSSYAPESGVRYDGIYRIEKCWRKIGIQGFKVCRYLFVRCENEPAPWTSDEHGDRPRPLPVIKELKNSTDIIERKERPAWDYDEGEGWRWMKPPPVSRKAVSAGNEEGKRARKGMRLAKNTSVRERLLKEFSCLICRKVMKVPLTTPCGHNFCKPCLVGAFAGQSYLRERTCVGGRNLRAQKIVKACPSCPNDITEFLQNPQVNTEMMDLIESLQSKTEENVEQHSEDGSDVVEQSIDDGFDATGEEKLSKDEAEIMMKKVVSDNMEKLEETTDAVEGMKLDEEVSDSVEENVLEAVDGDSEVNASEIEETDSLPFRKRNKTVVQMAGVKRARKSGDEDGNKDEIANDEKNETEEDGEKVVEN